MAVNPSQDAPRKTVGTLRLLLPLVLLLYLLPVRTLVRDALRKEENRRTAARLQTQRQLEIGASLPALEIRLGELESRLDRERAPHIPEEHAFFAEAAARLNRLARAAGLEVLEAGLRTLPHATWTTPPGSSALLRPQGVECRLRADDPRAFERWLLLLAEEHPYVRVHSLYSKPNRQETERLEISVLLEFPVLSPEGVPAQGP